MKALVHTSHDGHQIYTIKNKNEKGYYLYNNRSYESGHGIWFAYEDKVIKVENTATVEELKITHPEYFL